MNLCIVEGEKLVREHRDNAVFVLSREKDSRLFDKISSLETDQGILAIVPIPTAGAVTYPFLVLDGIQDPGNVGTLLRTACAFGFNTVFTINCADVWSQKVIRSSMGATFHLNIIDGIENIPTDVTLFVADLNGQMNTKRPDKNFGIVLGSEGQGISPAIKSIPHQTVTIKTTSNVDSLNVAVAGGILMHMLVK